MSVQPPKEPGLGTLALHAGQTPDPAYHDMACEEALRPVGNIACIIHMADLDQALKASQA